MYILFCNAITEILLLQFVFYIEILDSVYIGIIYSAS